MKNACLLATKAAVLTGHHLGVAANVTGPAPVGPAQCVRVCVTPEPAPGPAGGVCVCGCVGVWVCARARVWLLSLGAP